MVAAGLGEKILYKVKHLGLKRSGQFLNVLLDSLGNHHFSLLARTITANDGAP
jgi:hypothetical protein